MNKIDNTISESLYSTNTLEKTISVLVKKSLTNNNNSVNLKTRQVLRQIILLLIFFFALVTINAQQVKAFPSAKGAGAYATGGRGKPVYIVTNLNNSGVGSFRQALENTRATNGGIVTFAVSGTIVLTSKLEFRDQDNITIAGQTSPSGGITIVASNSSAKFQITHMNNLIMRYVRFRPHYLDFPATELDALNISHCNNYIIDHCSMSWGTDENADSGNGSDFTWQRNLFAESNKTGMILGGEVENSENMSFINNMFYNCNKRFPNYQSDGRVDVINNVVWNFRTLISVSQGGHELNHIGNYYQYFTDSPAADEGRWNLWYPFNQTVGGTTLSEYPSIYTKGNYISDVLTDPNADNYFTWRWRFNPVGSPYAGVSSNSQLTTDFKANTQFPLLGSPFVVQSAVDGFENVKYNVGANARLNENGNSIENLDVPDSIYLNNVQNNIRVDYTPESNLSTAHFNAFQANVSITPINTHPSNFDTNNDGIPNQWVVNKGFGVNDNLTTHVWASGYVGIEEYLNEVDNTNNNTSNTTLAEDDNIQTPENTIINGDVSTNDSDPEGDNQTISSARADINGNGVSDNLMSIGNAISVFGTNDVGAIEPGGTITLSTNGSYTYSPATNFTGTIEIPYTVIDDNTLPATDTAILYLDTLPNLATDCSLEITTFPYSEGFENTLGDWTQSSVDDIDWTVDANGTPSNGTGPSSATQGTYYVYVEASNNLNKQAILNSPCFNLSGLSEANFSFKYHQYGSTDMGHIDLEASDDNGASWMSIWDSTGNLGNTWLTADVDLGAFVGGNVKLRFNRNIGNTWQADIALDEVSLSVVNTVVDIEAPVITLIGTSTINLNIGDTYNELGATATDNVDGDITGNINIGGDTVSTNVIGTYIVTYRVSDAAGNDAIQKVRTVNVSGQSSGCSVEITTFPYSEGFENTLGDWTQSSVDDIDWTVDANGTPSNGTGPSSATQGTYYVYVEASNNLNKQAILNSPCFNLSGLSEANFSFKYHQYGSTDMGHIDLEASDDNGASWMSIWDSAGNLGDSWQSAHVNLSAYTGGSVQLRFNRITSKTWVADLAIDDVSLYEENAGGDRCSEGISSFPYSEGFENTLGAWTQSSTDDNNWTVNTNVTPSNGTGPSSAFKGAYYIYVEASGTGTGIPTKQALLNSPCFDLSSQDSATFSFNFHQFGASDMGTIDLEASHDNGASWVSIWNSSGNLGNSWQSANVNLSTYIGGSVQLRFNRITGSTWQADIAIDNVNLSTGMARIQTAKTVFDDIKEVTIYPNPVKDNILNIKSTYTNISYKIYSTVGQLVSKGNVKNNAINIGDLNRAIYQITFFSEGEIITKQFIKQ